MRNDELVEMKSLIRQLKIDETVIEESIKIYIDKYNLKKEHWFMPVCIYTACKQRKIIMTLKTLSNVTGIERKDLARGYRRTIRNPPNEI